MPNRNGYLPLGQDEHDDEDYDASDNSNKQQQPPRHLGHPDQTQAQTQTTATAVQDEHKRHGHAVTVSTTGKPYHYQHQHQVSDQNQGGDADTDCLLVKEDRDSEDEGILSSRHDTRSTSSMTTSTTTTSTTTSTTVQAKTAAALRQTNSNVSRPESRTIASAPAATTTTTTTSTPIPSFQFPRFGTKHRSLLGLKDKGESRTTHYGASATASILSARRGEREGVSSPSDLAHIRPKRHPHTTLDGPRGIRKSQRRQVLREIRPDPHNLPEELLREQAKSGAVVDAIMTNNENNHNNNTNINTNNSSSDMVAGEGPSSVNCTTSTGGGGNGGSNNIVGGHGLGHGERGTLLGAGDGLGLGIGLGGKANAHPSSSRWTRPNLRLGRRQRWVPGSGIGRENDQRMIHSSVFTPVTGSVDGVQPMTPAPALTPDHGEPMTSERFVGIVDSVKEAIRSGIQPLRIAQGSSGSYFCRNADGKIVGVFKPKNEEPYGQLNPKWAKWIHRNLFPCCFGRSCLIPNLGYISESATSLVDRRLKLNIVPSTEVVWLSSPAFHYDYLDRRAAQLHKGAKPLPDKVGSFQLFLNGFKDANLFMRDHPWPVEQPTIPASANGGATTGGEGSHGKGRHSSIWRRPSRDSMRSFQQDADGSSVHGSHMGSTHGGLSGDRHGFTWTPALQQQFREQFEKMIILDYLIRNTDRGLDNWMIRYCEKEGISIVAGPPSGTQKGNLQNQQQQQHQASRRGSRVGDLLGLTSDRGSPRSSSSSMREGAERNSMLATPPGTPPRSNLSRVVSGKEFLQDGEESNSMAQQRKRSGSLTEQSSSEAERIAGSSSAARDMNANTIAGPTTIESHYGENHVHVAAIDNGLAFPFKHPDSWRSYPYGWLFLPRPLIAQPFTKATRDHFLPLLSSPVWWRETIADLRRLFSIDSDFDQGMFNKQMAVMKGQGWNIVETLKNQEHGPIDLCRRVAVVVWDEEVTVQGGNTIPLPGQMNIQNQGQQALHQQQQSQGYVTTQPRSMTMDAAKASYSNYGSIMTVSDRLSGIKALPTSPSAIGEGTPFFKKGSLPHMAIPIDEVANSSSYNQLKHDSFREVVSDGEYDVHDEDEDEDEDEEEDEDEDGFSYDEEYDDFEYELDMDAEEVNNSTAGDNQDASQLSLPAACRDGMVSIDMTLADPTTAMQRNQQRLQSHQSEGGRGRSRRQRRRSSSAVMRVHRGRENGALVADSTLDEVDTQTTKKNHRRSQTEHDDKKGTIRFEAAASPERSPVQASKVTSLSMTGDTFHSHENNHIVDIPPNPAVEEDEPERGRSRGFFARGYGAISSSKNQHSLNQALSSSASPDSNHGGGRPKWSDRLRRGLSFDGHLLAVGGIGQAAKRERKLRKQRQREREQCVVLVERIEPAKNLPFFEWW